MRSKLRLGPSGVDAPNPHAAELLETIDDYVEFLCAEWRLGQLPVVAALFQSIALNLYDLRPPVGMSLDIADQLPNIFDRSIDPCLLAVRGHRTSLSAIPAFLARRLIQVESNHD
jgi:hypothetical protein